MVPSFAIFFIFTMFIIEFLFKNMTIVLHFSLIFTAPLLGTFFLINYFHCSEGFAKRFDTVLTCVYICLFSILLIDDIVDIQKIDRICSTTFAADVFSGLFLNSSSFFTKHSRCINGAFIGFWY